MKYIIALVIGLMSLSAWADNSSVNLAIPSPAQSYQSDRIRSGELDCSNAIGGGSTVEFGVTGIVNIDNDPLSQNQGTRGKDVGVYARITIPLDGPAERINCNTLYELELERKQMEVEKLKQELNNLRRLQFENAK